jgi:hypothetical protein
MHYLGDPGSSLTAAWNISAEDFPHSASRQEKWKFLIRYALLSPSIRNTQPWMFRLQGSELELHADRKRACRVVDPHGRELIMSCGCALYHLRIAMSHFGYLGWIDLLPDLNNPDLLARISMGVEEERSRGESMLFYAILSRRTNRQPFSNVPVPAALLSALQHAAEDEFACLTFVEPELKRKALAALIAEGDHRQWADENFRLELSGWLHPDAAPACDGIPNSAQGADDLLLYANPLVLGALDMGAGQAARDQETVARSPVLAVLSTNGDETRDWLLAGQALARMLLRASTEGVSASFLNQAIELPDLRQRLCALFGSHHYPQICLRLGFGDQTKPTPRRELEEVII